MSSAEQTFNPYEASEVPSGEVTAGSQPWKDIARRWEKRRIWFNVVMLVIGIPMMLLAFGTSAVFEIPGVIAFGIAANVCYTFGPIAEMYVNWFVDSFEERIPPAVCALIRSGSLFTMVFIMGTAFSMLLVVGICLVFAIDTAIPNQN